MALIAHTAPKFLFIGLGQFGDRQDVSVATTLNDVLGDPFQLLEELLAMWKDDGAWCERYGAKPSQTPPRRHPSSAR
jgi:hypothetical protein